MSELRPYVEVIGEGPDLVLLHGWGVHGNIWDTVTPLLAEHFTLHIVDLPGFGRSPIPNQAYTVDMILSQIFKAVPEKAYWMGWSLGGALAKAAAIRHPEKISQLITVASSPCFLQSDDWQHAMKPDVMHGFARFLEEDYEGTIIRFLAIQAMGSETQREDIRILKETVFIHGQPAPKALRGGLALLGELDLREDLEKITQPWHRIYGRLDSLVPVQSADAVKAIHPNTTHTIMNKASHAPFISHKNQFVEEVLQFLSKEAAL